MRHTRFLLLLFGFWVALFSGFRVLTWFYNLEKATDATRAGLGGAFWLGFRFDCQTACYALVLPLLWLSVSAFRGRIGAWEGRFLRVYAWLVSFAALAICAADVPYFAFFNSRITTAALLWKDTPGQMAKFVLGSPEYYPFLLATGASAWLLWRLVRFFWKKSFAVAAGEPALERPVISPKRQHWLLKIGVFLALVASLVIGMRGGWQRVPLVLRDSFQGNDGFLNQLSINPVHSWFDSFRVFNVNFMPDEEAIALTRRQLGIPADSTRYASPIARFQADSTAPARRPNVVMLLVESLSAERLSAFGNPKKPMPFLDSLIGKSLFFNNFYSTGIHTSNGLVGTFFSQPALFGVHPMSNVSATGQHFAGIPTTLKRAGYRTLFCTTADRAFDNMGFFLGRNGFDQISDMHDYPPELWVNNWGVSDKSILDRGLRVLDTLGRDLERPFFAALLTISTHPPYILPPDAGGCPFRSNMVIEQVWEYTDWCIANFVRGCARQPWFENTIFVILGDHGWLPPDGSPYDVALPFNHVPCLFFAPRLIAPETRAGMASQVDVYPTLMDLLGIEFVNNTLGINLLKEKRPYAVFSQDSKIGVVDERFLYVLRKSGSTALYDFRGGSTTDLQATLPGKADSMRLFGASFLQTGQWILDKRLTGQ